MELLKKYVDLFNSLDEEIHKNLIDNENAYEWLKNEIPLFECPDEDIQRTYYFRWWTFRKHLKHTEDGYVFTEFLPDVPWSGKHNTINAPLGHQIYEGRWLNNSKKYLKDYINFFLNNSKDSHSYSTWFIYAVYQFCLVSGDLDMGADFIKKICRYYEEWEETHLLDCGLFWSFDDRDAMEFSISGTTEDLRMLKGVRPTLNSYMCADAWAVSEFAKFYGENEISLKYKEKYNTLRENINKFLWKDGFYRAFHFEDGEDVWAALLKDSPREEIGYIPWMFNIPNRGYEDVFKLLLDENVFYTQYGIATADKSHKRYLYNDGKRACSWNGYVWPFATSQTLTALRNVCMEFPEYKNILFTLLKQYAKSQTRITGEGKTIPWIDEARHSERDEWVTRESFLKNNWRNNGGYERGKDYNHSTFCDLVISGLVGVKYENDTLDVSPAIPDDWEWFKLENLKFRDKFYTIIYDKTGEKYNKGKGIIIIAEN